MPNNLGNEEGRRLTWTGIVERTGDDNRELARIDRSDFFGRMFANGIVGLGASGASSVSKTSASGDA